jgi:hypothetical protein
MYSESYVYMLYTNHLVNGADYLSLCLVRSDITILWSLVQVVVVLPRDK